MHVAILHYHLNRGGVTQVVFNQLRALATLPEAEGLRIEIVYGGRRSGWRDDALAEIPRLQVRLHELPSLDYEPEDLAPRPAQLADELRGLFGQLGLKPDGALLHVHNHNLGKNLSLPGALGQLAGDGYALLLQIHDFAEDFRPDNYRRIADALGGELNGLVYPSAAHIHYAALNCRDEQILCDAGAVSGRVHRLPNPVVTFDALPPRDEARERLARSGELPADRRLLLYPVRGIRRKNLGEALLWSLLAGEGWVVGLTLPPLNPLEQPSFNRWRELATALRLSCKFELGAAADIDFPQLLAAADGLLTTSVAEGFGMVFLESCLLRRPLVGRNLAEITADFATAGIRLPGLQPTLQVPLDWVGADAFSEAFTAAYTATLGNFGRALPDRAKLDASIQALVESGAVDFAYLATPLQEQVIRIAHGDAARRAELLEHNPWIPAALDQDPDAEILASNACAARDGYGLPVSGRRLWELYGKVAASRQGEPERPLDGARILEAFLDVARFHPLRVEA